MNMSLEELIKNAHSRVSGELPIEAAGEHPLIQGPPHGPHLRMVAWDQNSLAFETASEE